MKETGKKAPEDSPMLDMVLQGVLGVLQPINILTLILTVSLGIVIGALPGFGAATGLILGASPDLQPRSRHRLCGLVRRLCGRRIRRFHFIHPAEHPGNGRSGSHLF